MKAVKLKTPGLVAVEEIETPRPGKGEVLLRVLAAGVCRTDLHIRHDPNQSTPAGTTLGHEIAGEIAALGDGVNGWTVGNRAVVHPCWACHTCAACRAGRENACQGTGSRDMPPPTPGVSMHGGMADYAVVPAASLIAIGDLDPAFAAVLADAGLAPYHSVRLVRDRLTPGTTAVVIGLGGLGQFALQMLRIMAPAKIVALDISDDALALARPVVDAVFRADGVTVAKDVLAITKNQGAEVVIDLVGTDASLRLSASIVAPYGAIQAIGLSAGSAPFETDVVSSIGLPWGATFMKPYSGSYRDLADVIALAQDGRLTARIERFALQDATAAFDRLEAGKVSGRAVLIPE
jgi:alcohol dehydrogenase, propanol-preferring